MQKLPHVSKLRYLYRRDRKIYISGIVSQFHITASLSLFAPYMLKKLSHSIIGQTLFSLIFACIIFILGITVRWQHENYPVYLLVKQNKKPYIIISWHEHILGMTWNLPRPITTLNSPHSDGRILGNAVQMVGLDVVWGSSNKKALSSLRQLAKELKKGRNVGITPDGPRGPARTLAMGPIALAHMSDVEIIPVVFAADRQWRLKSWDKTRIPKPFSKAIILWGEPIKLEMLNTEDRTKKLEKGNITKNHMSKQSLENWRREIEVRLNVLTQQCDELCANSFQKDSRRKKQP